mgnify:CR=1 FL=1
MVRKQNWISFLALVFGIAFSIIGFSGCSSTNQSSSKTLTYDGFISQLSKSGLEVSDKIQPIDNISKSLFSVQPKVVSIYSKNGKEEIYIYSFSNKKITDSEIKRVSGNGSKVGNLYIEGDRHFFKYENMIIAYLGSNKTIIGNLENILGKPFADSNS